MDRRAPAEDEEQQTSTEDEVWAAAEVEVQ